jgi:arabinofuranan 3-O-arabinosyltransferase
MNQDDNKRKIGVSIIVPVYNSRITLLDLLHSLSLSKYKNFELIINDDKFSTDNISDLVVEYSNKGFQIEYLRLNENRTQARKVASKKAKGEFLLHIDSDMQISVDLLNNCINECEKNNFDALIIPEVSLASNFWGRCRAMERECYLGIELIESLRFVKKSVYDAVGGHDKNMIFSEDKDLDLRIRDAGYKVGRAEVGKIYHNEGKPSLKDLVLKKFDYSFSAEVFAKKHRSVFVAQSNILLRYWYFLKNFRLFFKNPIVYIAMICVKTLEYCFSAFGLMLSILGIKKKVK